MTKKKCHLLIWVHCFPCFLSEFKNRNFLLQLCVLLGNIFISLKNWLRIHIIHTTIRLYTFLKSEIKPFLVESPLPLKVKITWHIHIRIADISLFKGSNYSNAVLRSRSIFSGSGSGTLDLFRKMVMFFVLFKKLCFWKSRVKIVCQTGVGWLMKWKF